MAKRPRVTNFINVYLSEKSLIQKYILTKITKELKISNISNLDLLNGIL